MALGMEVSLGPGHIVLDEDAAPPAKGAQQPPSFRPMSTGEGQLNPHLTQCRIGGGLPPYQAVS